METLVTDVLPKKVDETAVKEILAPEFINADKFTRQLRTLEKVSFKPVYKKDDSVILSGFVFVVGCFTINPITIWIDAEGKRARISMCRKLVRHYKTSIETMIKNVFGIENAIAALS